MDGRFGIRQQGWKESEVIMIEDRIRARVDRSAGHPPADRQAAGLERIMVTATPATFVSRLLVQGLI